MQRLTNALTSAVYLTPLAVRRFRAAHPSEPVLLACPCKGVRESSPRPLARGLHWVGARRANLILTKQRLVCGDWEIPVDSVVRAELLSFGATLVRGRVLVLATREGLHYQLGTNDHPAWGGELPFPVERRSEALATSPVRRIVQAVACLYLGYAAGRIFGWW